MIDSASWNPWHGCTKVSPGCKYCYVYRQDAMYGEQIASSEVRKTLAFDLPTKRKRDGSYKIAAGTMVYTCFTSDFLVEQADPWRAEAWAMMCERADCTFFFFTKRIDRFAEVAPADWGEGYENVIVGCTIENQAMADYRLPIFRRLPIRHKVITAAPLLERVDLRAYLDETIEEVALSGESGYRARVLEWEWVLDMRAQCVAADVPFLFHQTGARLLKDGKLYRIPRRHQIAQAYKAAVHYRIGSDWRPLAKES